jgi:TolA-binding protein
MTAKAFGEDALEEANKLYARKDYQAALAAFRNIVARELDVPTKAKAMFNLGLTLKQLHQYEGAIAVFQRVNHAACERQGKGRNT